MPGCSCIVPTCKNKSGQERKVIYFLFSKDIDTQTEWLGRCGLDVNKNIKQQRVCSMVDDFEDALRSTANEYSSTKIEKTWKVF